MNCEPESGHRTDDDQYTVNKWVCSHRRIDGHWARQSVR